jgi:hypothetical protein
MKKIFIIGLLACIGVNGFSQQDSTIQKKDTVTQHHHGKNSNHWKDWDHEDQHDMMPPWPMPPHWRNNHVKPANVSTNWLIFDIGFTNYNDKSNYGGTTMQNFAPGSQPYWFSLNTKKSVDVNIWLFMQRLNLYQHVINLKYGLGIELNNYRYQTNIKYLTNPTEVIMDTLTYTKNKLAADYATVPLMINFNFTPNLREGFGISVGMSAGYLYSSRQKLISNQFGKHKTFNTLDLNPWKLSWIAEVQLGPLKLYGSLATKTMFNSAGPDQTPYTFGLRFSNW